MQGYEKCETCQEQKAVKLWIQVHLSFGAARMSGQGPEWMSALGPGPGILKVQVCFSCSTFRPCLEFTDEEQEAMKKYAKDQKESAERSNDLGSLFGL